MTVKHKQLGASGDLGPPALVGVPQSGLWPRLTHSTGVSVSPQQTLRSRSVDDRSSTCQSKESSTKKGVIYSRKDNELEVHWKVNRVCRMAVGLDCAQGQAQAFKFGEGWAWTHLHILRLVLVSGPRVLSPHQR